MQFNAKYINLPGVYSLGKYQTAVRQETRTNRGLQFVAETMAFYLTKWYSLKKLKYELNSKPGDKI